MRGKPVTILILADQPEMALGLLESFRPNTGRISELTTIYGFLGRFYSVGGGDLELVAAPTNSDLPSLFDLLTSGVAGYIVVVDCAQPESIANVRAGLDFWELISASPRIVALLNHNAADALDRLTIRQQLRLSSTDQLVPLPDAQLRPAILQLLKLILNRQSVTD
ncbi:MAG: hypothetical protein GF399_06845 [Candidatus Coatesbacteria bacterium]|jgi:hypothetical protein|nr:hypothetical protein [Candidatus Coatesbacteria bacterium]